MRPLSIPTYFKYEIETAIYTTIRTDMPSALQIGVDVDGNLWGGGLETGTIQKMDTITLILLTLVILKVK